MDQGVKNQYEQFLRSNAGKDLIDRLKTTEATYMMTGMKATTLEDKGMAFVKMGAVYAVRTMLDDLAKPTPKPVKKSKSV